MPLKITVLDKPADDREGMVVLAISDARQLQQQVEAPAAKSLGKALKEREFQAVWGAVEILPAPQEWQAAFVAVIGLGGEESVYKQREAVRRGMGHIVAEARRHVVRQLAFVLPGEAEAVPLAGAAVEAALLADYRFAPYKKKLQKEQKTRGLQELAILAGKRTTKQVREIVGEAQKMLRGVEVMRDLINQPASHMSPRVLVEEARELAEASNRISVKVLNRKQAEKQHFSAFLAVAKGSSEEPYVIHLKYTPKKKAKKKIVLVGKGITFDSGGLSLKPAQFMENMKIDMGGAAIVLGIFRALTELDVSVEVHGVIAACENMPSGTAYRPGDVIEAKNGKTIEVLNTDAEGRITLADALTYAGEVKPDAIIDMATLTGAAMVALGDTHAALWSTNDALQAAVMTAAQDEGEGLVAFPLPAEYKPTIESKVADLRNVSTMDRLGGAITAALFLQEFVPEGIPWVHIDVAGPVYAERPSLPYYGIGATGYGVRTMVRFLQNFGG